LYRRGQKRFSELKHGSGQKKKVLALFQQFIRAKAGGDAQGLIAAYLGTHAGKASCQNFIYEVPRMKNVLMILKKCYQLTSDYNKRQWLSVVREAGFSAGELWEMGWGFSKKAWCTAGKHTSNQYAGAPVREDRGRPKVSPVIVESITKHALSDEMSRPASNRTVIVNSEPVPVRYKNSTDRESYVKWKTAQKETGVRSCSESTFSNVLKTIRNLKIARKETDKCEICVEGARCKKELEKLNGKRLRKKSDNELIKKLKKCITLFERHEKDHIHQRQKFKQQKEALIHTPTDALLLIDFKANLILNQDASVQVSKEYFQTPQRSLFGAVLYYSENGVIVKHHFDVLSDCVSHNSFFVTKALDLIFSHEHFSSKSFTSISFWLDNGPHFKTKELFHYFYNIPDNFPDILNVQWNNFVEYHGKNDCDARFSQISAAMRQYVNNSNNPHLTDVEQIASVIADADEVHNEKRDRDQKPKINSTQLILSILEMPPTKKSVNITHFKQEYYSFRRLGNTIQASFLTDWRKVKTWNYVELVTNRKGVLLC